MGNDIWNIIYKIAISYGSSDVMFIASSNGLYRSLDYNSSNPTWVKTLNGFIYDIEVKPESPNHIYAAVFDDLIYGQIHPGTVPKWYIMESNDYGQTWTDIISEPTEITSNDKCSFTIEVSKAKPDFLYCLAKVNNNSSLYYIDFNNSASWVFSTSINSGYGAGHAFGVDQSGDGNSVFVSRGTTGERVNISTGIIGYFNATHADIEDIVCHPYNPNEVWVAHHGGVDKSLNNGPSCVSKSNGLNVAQVMRMANSHTTSDLVSVGLYHDGTAITNSTYGINWTPSWRFLYGGDGMKTIIDFVNSNRIFGSAQYGSWFYTQNLFMQTSGFLHCSDWQTEGEINKCDPAILYLIGTNDNDNSSPNYRTSKKIFRTNDQCATRVEISNGINYSTYDNYLFWELYTSKSACDDLFVSLIEYNSSGTYFHLYKTNNANSTAQSINWVELPIPSVRWISSVVPDKSNPNIVYIVYSNSENINSYPNSVGQVYKIDYSDTHNPVYQDITFDLPYSFTGSGCLELMNSVDNSIYLSTDIGVFYINDYLMTQQNKWHLVGSDCPHVSSNGLDINYPSGKLRVGTMGRGVWEADIPCDKFPETAFINQNTIWDDYMIINRNVSINSGVTLTVTQSGFIKLLDDVKIIVEPGAKLIVDGGTLTNICGALWQGIEVQGKANQSQLVPGAQGQVILKNGAVIENAIDGITTIGNVEDMSSWDWSKTGGIIKAENSTFRNCRRGIQFLTYNNVHPTLGSNLPNLSTIRNCTFETTTDLPDGIMPYAFISMNEVNGVKLYGNTFQNTNPNANWFTLGMGIYSINASYLVDQSCLSATIPCSNAQKSRFINLHYGIRSSSTPGLKAVTVKNTVFDLCHFGVYFSGMEYPTVINNDFIVDDYTFHMMTNEYGYGLYLNQCNGFQVEGNDFMSPTSGNRGWTGIYVNNSNTGNGANSSNEIYRNTFTDLYSGIVALNDNDGLYLSDGLKFNCETFNGNTYDISVLPKSNPNIGISAVQGLYFANSFNAKTLSRNWYSATCTGDENQFKIDWYSSEDPTEDPTKAPIEYPIMHANYSGAHWQPECYDPMLQTYSPPLIDNITYSSSDCPDRTILNPIAIRTELQVVSTKKEELNNLIDGGQTNLLVSIAQSNIPEGQMLQTMLEFSPYLSDEVLLMLIERPNALSPGTMQQILAANSPLSDEVYQAVQAMQTPLPKGIRNQIAALQTGEMSDRDQLPYGIAYYEYTEKVLESDLVRYYLNDTLTVNPMDSVMNILEQATTKNSKLNLVSAYISSRHFAKANQTLDSLVNIDADLVSYSEKQRMNILTADLPGKELSLLTDSSKMQVLQSIANDTLQYGAVYAKNTLELLNDTLFAELTLIPMPETDNRSMIAYSSGNQPEIENGLITCYPNPAGEKFTAHYEVESVCSEMFLVIHNVMGKEVSRIRVNECIGDVELSSPAESGTYYVYIESCGQYIAIDKIVVTR